MSISTSFNAVTNFNYGPLGYTGRVGQNAVLSPQVAQLLDAYHMLGQPISFANALANLPPASLPRPPLYSSSLGQAQDALSQFLGQAGAFVRRGAPGYQQFLSMEAMSATVGRYTATQGQYMQQTTIKASYVNEFPGRPPVGIDPTSSQRVTKDEFGTGLGAGKGHESNLANSPEVVLALNSILAKNKNIKMDKLQQELKDKFGIESELTKINGRKALKFANGDHIVDANGNGLLDAKDYNFKGAVKAIQDKYGLTDDQVSNFGNQQVQPQAAVSQAQAQYQVSGLGQTSFYNRPYNFPSVSAYNQIFALAMFYAQ